MISRASGVTSPKSLYTTAHTKLSNPLFLAWGIVVQLYPTCRFRHIQFTVLSLTCPQKAPPPQGLPVRAPSSWLVFHLQSKTAAPCLPKCLGQQRTTDTTKQIHTSWLHKANTTSTILFMCLFVYRIVTYPHDFLFVPVSRRPHELEVAIHEVLAVLTARSEVNQAHLACSGVDTG